MKNTLKTDSSATVLEFCSTNLSKYSAEFADGREKLVEVVNQQITRMVATGASPDKAIKTIAKQFNTTKSNAGRVVMTESAYFASAAQKDSFTELGVELYRIIGTLDGEMCEVCGDMDSRIYKMSEYIVGSTAPPFHPWCRCCTAPYFEDMVVLGERFARDIETGERYKLPKDVTYNGWKAMQEAAYGSGFVDKKRKMSYNISVDSEQYGRYKEYLGKNAPKSLAAFQNIKYSDDWNSFKAYTRSIKSGELTPLANFKLYKKTSLQIDDVLVGSVTNNGLTVTEKSNHFIARIIGSVEQRRNGVDVSEALDAITDPVKVDPIRVNNNGRSQRFKGKSCYVTINPDTGMLIQTNPHKGGK